MIALLTPTCSLSDKARIIDAIERVGLRAHLDRAEGRERIGAPGASSELARALASFPGVAEVHAHKNAYALVGRETVAPGTKSRVRVGNAVFGGEEIVVCAGPCAVETREQIDETAGIVARLGATVLRGGAFKPRTSPYSFQGLGQEGLELLRAAGDRTGLPVVTEVLAPADVERVADYADMLQVGARNMQNFSLLRAVGEVQKPVWLKRGMMSTIEELLLAAEYVVDAGNPDVVLCERGIRSFDRSTRNLFDVTAIPLLKRETHLPVVADPSHGCGVRDLVPHVARAAIAAGADGIMVEVHPRPDQALSDGPQSLTPEGFAAMMRSLVGVARSVGRDLRLPEAGA